MSHGNSRTEQTVITTPARKKVIRSLSRRSYKAATSSFSELPQAKDYLLKGFVHTINKEIATICSQKHSSILRGGHESIKRFSWDRIWSEMNENMPTHLKFLQCLLPKSDRRLIFFLICAVLKKRCMEMSLIQQAISFLLYVHGTSREVRAIVCSWIIYHRFVFRSMHISSLSWFAWHHQLRAALWTS